MIKKWRKIEWPKTLEWHKGKKFFIVKPNGKTHCKDYRLPQGFFYAIYKAGAHEAGCAKQIGYSKKLATAKKRVDKLIHSGNAAKCAR